jgi:hypothetical protein
VEKYCRFKTKAASFLTEANVSNVKDREAFIVDSGCTNHMSNDKDILTDMIPCLENIKLAKNEQSMVTESVGSINSENCNLKKVFMFHNWVRIYFQYL